MKQCSEPCINRLYGSGIHLYRFYKDSFILHVYLSTKR
ncbi:Uncharacterised protein [Vibrio cholerae]|nr:Uncharacterised protein [Vibrio cholerae]